MHRAFSAWGYRLKYGWQRATLAWAYFRQRIPADRAVELLVVAEQAAGIYGLESISCDDVRDRILDDYEDHPKLKEFVASATERVGRKWDSYCEIISAAVDWAAELVHEYAGQEGVTLVKTEVEEETSDG